MTSTVTQKPTRALDRVREVLDRGQVAEALEFIQDSGQRSPGLENARGVCLLRLGRNDHAAALFRDLVFPSGSFSIPPETPTVFRVNYVLALLKVRNVMMARTILKEIPDQKHPAVAKVRAALDRWKKGLGLLRRLLLLVGVYPDAPVTLDAPIGEL